MFQYYKIQRHNEELLLREVAQFLAFTLLKKEKGV